MKSVIIGCGSIGRRHANNLASRDDVELTLFDTDPEQAEQVANEIGATVAPSRSKALEGDPDITLVCTPTHLHVEHARQALERNSHVFVEKPISHTPDGVEALIRLSEEQNRVLMVGCNMRFHPPVHQITQWLEQDEIGRVQFIRMRFGHDLRNWRDTDYQDSYSASNEQGGGIILDAVHELDLALLWLDSVTSITASSGQLSDLDLDVEDTADIILESEQNAACALHFDYLRPRRARTYELIGGDGMIRWDAEGKQPETSTLTCYSVDGDTRMRASFEMSLNDMYTREMEHFLNCVSGSETPAMDGERGASVLHLARLAKRSANTGTSKTVSDTLT
jgi:predicted dehydrogenase